MSIFLGGAAPNSATAETRIAAIKAVLLSSDYLKTSTEAGSVGLKYVDTTALVAYLREQLLSISTTDGTPPDPALVYQFAETTDVVLYVNAWSALVAAPGTAGRNIIRTVEEATTALVAIAESLKNNSTRLTDHFEQAKTSTLDAIPGGYDVVAPNYLPEVTANSQDTRAYVYTYVTDWGWESAPSPPSDVKTVFENDTMTITGAAPPAGRNVKRIRLYRSNTSNTGAAFQFVVQNGVDVDDAEWASTLSSRQYVDELSGEELQEVIPSITWSAPPDDLKGIKAMPNGVLIGFLENSNQLLFNEPFVPYAWPEDYRLTTEHKIVGIGVFGQTAVVLTEGFPYYVSGADSSSMSAQKMEFPQSCIAKRTIATADGGVVYASPDGLCLASSSGVVNLLQGAVSRLDWKYWLGAQVNWPSTFGSYHEGVYYIFNYTGSGYAVDLTSKKISQLTQVSTGVYTDMVTDKIYVVSGTTLLDLFGSASPNTGVWRSKKFVVSNHPAFACLRVESTFESPVTVILYGNSSVDPTYIATFTSRAPQRLPPGQYREIELQIESTYPVTRVTMATSMHELASI